MVAVYIINYQRELPITMILHINLYINPKLMYLLTSFLPHFFSLSISFFFFHFFYFFLRLEPYRDKTGNAARNK